MRPKKPRKPFTLYRKETQAPSGVTPANVKDLKLSIFYYTMFPPYDTAETLCGTRGFQNGFISINQPRRRADGVWLFW